MEVRVCACLSVLLPPCPWPWPSNIWARRLLLANRTGDMVRIIAIGSWVFVFTQGPCLTCLSSSIMNEGVSRCGLHAQAPAKGMLRLGDEASNSATRSEDVTAQDRRQRQTRLCVKQPPDADPCAAGRMLAASFHSPGRACIDRSRRRAQRATTDERDRVSLATVSGEGRFSVVSQRCPGDGGGGWVACHSRSPAGGWQPGTRPICAGGSNAF